MKEQTNPQIQFVIVFLERVDTLHIPELPEESQWAQVLQRMKAEGKSSLRSFSAEMMNVIFADTIDWPAARVQEADSVLVKNGALSLSTMRSKKNRRLVKILSKRKIGSMADYVFVKDSVEDDPVVLGKALMLQLDALLVAFDEASSKRTTKNKTTLANLRTFESKAEESLVNEHYSIAGHFLQTFLEKWTCSLSLE